jgi:hypothetical protein
MHKLLGYGIFLFALVGCVALTGCGPELSEQELGTVAFEMPSVVKKTQPNTEESATESTTKAATDAKDTPQKEDSSQKEEGPAQPQ